MFPPPYWVDVVPGVPATLADGRIALIVDCDALDARPPKAESRDRGARSAEASTVTGNGRVAA